MFLFSCKKEQEYVAKSADMLNITNDEKSFSGCMSRYNSVISAIKTKINVLENEHNSSIQFENAEEYFLDENYIHSLFEPFNLETLSVTDGFNEEMDNQKAQEYYFDISQNMGITYDNNGDSYELTFVSESTVKKYSAEYDSKNDSLKYSYSVEETGNEKVEEYLEFININENTYMIQSHNERCYVEFDENGEITYFIVAKLDSKKFNSNESIYPTVKDEVNGFWTISKGKPNYIYIHTFENNVLTHEDSNGGSWKSIKINAEDYESAFMGL